MELFCRVSMPYEDLKEAFQLIADEVEKLVVYQHEADEDVNRTHCHFYVVYPHSTDTLKNRFKRTLPTTSKRGNSLWAFNTEYKEYHTLKVIPVGPSCITYMSKGVLEPSMMKGFTQAEIDEYKSGWVEQPVKRSYQTKLQYIVKETPSEAKKRKNDLIAEMLTELKDHIPVNLEYHVDEKVVRTIIKILNDNNIIFSRYTIRDYYDTICSRAFTEKFIYSVINFLSPRT